MMLLDLADACRKSGLKVITVDGWQQRGHGQMAVVDAIVCHHTATAKTAVGDYPSLRIVRDGRSDLPGPLAQLGLGRSGTVYVIAAGLCFHAGVVRETWMGNSRAIGIEAEADGLSPWPPEQVDAYARLCAALAEHYQVADGAVLGHKEVCSPAGRKSDPNFDMDAFRGRVAEYMEEAVTPETIDAIAKSVLTQKITVKDADGDKRDISVEQLLREVHQRQTKGA